jgi:hypothetical protein
VSLTLLAPILALLAPDPARLGAAPWHEREAWHRRYDNPLSALALPAAHPDPEVQHRCRALRAKHLRGLDPVYREGVLHRDDYPAWVKRHVLEADSLASEARRAAELSAPRRVQVAAEVLEALERRARVPAELAEALRRALGASATETGRDRPSMPGRAE